MFSDESEEESAEEIDVYRKKYQLIIERCEVMQQDNERLVNRIHQVKKILKRRRKERRFLMNRLDMHCDNWRNIPLPLNLEDPLSEGSCMKSALGKNSKCPLNEKGKKGSIKRVKTKIVDKNAPKRPANPYFQFCQEQRNSTIEEMTSIGQPEPSKVEVTKHLANKWNMLTQDDKKIYYDMYEKSKERYAADMELYALSKSSNTAQNS
ncbi:non-histone protein 10 [Cimex lectularius]|uniref:HMG box domain-containing protein n=1 Tax=Cimex lectularius TaxID=79782 RepID=A0A8I6S7D7_CIMLE|nr:non-histone protein 10 [Cimex lectularius]